MSDMPLEEKKCQPCEGIGSPMSADEAAAHLQKVEGWAFGDSGNTIERTFITKNFVAAVNFIQKISETAEADDHHPDIHLTGYRNLTVELTTHAIGGLSENDFILAAKINQLPVELKG